MDQWSVYGGMRVSYGLLENLGTGVGDKKVIAEEIQNSNGASSCMYTSLLTKFYLLCLGQRVNRS